MVNLCDSLAKESKWWEKVNKIKFHYIQLNEERKKKLKKNSFQVVEKEQLEGWESPKTKNKYCSIGKCPMAMELSKRKML